MRIVFCNIGWMKGYRGVKKEDPITLGGAYVDKSHQGAEQYNFLNTDGHYYGYVCTKSNGSKENELHIEKIDSAFEGKEFIDEVLVVWVSKRPNDKVGNRIIGWYENARVYRYYQENAVAFYNIKANVEDCVLIPPMYRSYVIYQARVIGAGKGMGQSNIWVPKGEEAEEIVENCTNYIQGYYYERYDEPIREGQLSFITKDDVGDLESYAKRGDKLLEKNPLKAIQYYNKVIHEKGEDLNILYNKALGLANLRLYSKSREMFKYILTKDNNNKKAREKIEELDKLLKDVI
ncbi:hypothetical protein CLLI_21670 [Clostridium liquoris]|uniref:Tetratricopeptide repeat protein n=1 Tax=Clostridium liquoris TaxID=1289519 RepID=A0A2T0B1T1_9CLOT|nr:hypothetical protein [Clostridium liquoris]PRR77779.1 hypothetical protein CLLI_21670 [Clostridium liquoris]